MKARLADRFGVGLLYAAALAGTTIVMGTRSPTTRAAWLDWGSTNLENLRHHPIPAMVVSAFMSTGDTVWWVVLAVVGLGATGWVLGAWRTTLLVAAAHVLATLISEGIVAYRIHSGAVPADQRLLLDVGPSYIVVCALVAGVAYSRWPGRILCAIGFALVAPRIFTGLTRWEVSSVGHVCSVVIGLALPPLLRSWTVRSPIEGRSVQDPGGRFGST